MHTIRRKFTFDAGHRVMNHESVCNNYHGHRYDVSVEVKAPDLDSLGRVVDFGVIKSHIGTYLDTYFDHTMLLNSEDPFALLWASEQATGKKTGLFPGKPPVLFNQCNPTVENIASALFHEFSSVFAKLDSGLILGEVVVNETEKCSAVVNAINQTNPLVVSFSTGTMNSMIRTPPVPQVKEQPKIAVPPTPTNATPIHSVQYLIEVKLPTGEPGTMRQSAFAFKPLVVLETEAEFSSMMQDPRFMGYVRGIGVLRAPYPEAVKIIHNALSTHNTENK